MASVTVIHVNCCGEEVEMISVMIGIFNLEVEFTLLKHLKWN